MENWNIYNVVWLRDDILLDKTGIAYEKLTFTQTYKQTFNWFVCILLQTLSVQNSGCNTPKKTIKLCT